MTYDDPHPLSFAVDAQLASDSLILPDEKAFSDYDSFVKAQNDFYDAKDLVVISFEMGLSEFLDISRDHPKWVQLMELSKEFVYEEYKVIRFERVAKMAERLSELLCDADDF